MSIKKVYGKNSEKLKNKQVAIVGIGGLGCTVANLLARIGMNLIFIDNDIVDDTNLERQILFDKDDLLKNKADVAKKKLEQFSNIKSINLELNKDNISEIIPKNIDLVFDCTDNVKTRLLINDYCAKNKILWIYSGAVSDIGAIYFIDPKDKNRACFQCINQEKSGATSCEIGVLNTTVTVVASMTANLAINYFLDGKIEKDFLRLNIHNIDISKFHVKKNPKCSACKGVYNYL